MRNIVVLGSTGTIGRMTLEVIEQIGDYNIIGLATHSNTKLLKEQVGKFKPDYVCVYDQDASKNFSSDIPVFVGDEGLVNLVELDDLDFVMAAAVGAASLRSIYRALELGIKVAVANKEPIVIAGDFLMDIARKNRSEILPVDSEHSAIFQCLKGESTAEVRRIILTASGGPFYDRADLENVTKAEALDHPRWKMGSKITIDSATLMNKGFEVIEAYHLFGVPLDKIEVIIHPESIIHSMIDFVDGNIKAHLGKTDMKIPIQFALTYPKRNPIADQGLCFESLASLNFKKVDFVKFPCLKMAYAAAEKGAGYPVVLNAANEILVSQFLREEIGFLEITGKLENCLSKFSGEKLTSLEDILALDCKIRNTLC
ncbi:MAG: 1-deoxy-D-xylulose-5-phosphate reductoisomerase [bacterium]|nr:1-deoxy-D-xylulose-5-phosphate reductoisomerase [bacterium]